jgi:hypothetical protein
MLFRTPDIALEVEVSSSAVRCLLLVLLTLSSTLLRAAPMDLRRAEPTPEEVPRTDDAAADGWVSESLSSAAGRRLKEIGRVLEQPEKISGDALSGLLDPGFAASALQPPRLVKVFEDSSFVVLRGEARGGDRSTPYRGAEGLATALRQLAEPLRGATEIHSKIKHVGVDLSSASPVTRHLFSISGLGPSGPVELHSEWQATWTWDEGGKLLLVGLSSDGYEQARLKAKEAAPLFSDCTEAVLGSNPSFEEQLLRGTTHWLGQLEAALGTDLMGHSGLAVGDVNGDGLEDLYLPQQGGLPNRLFVQNPDGTATDRSAWAGVDWLDRSLSALFLDLDNDGDQDLLIGTTPGLLVLENGGQGRFTLRSTLREARYAYSLAAADYDNDGDLDVYVARYNPIRDDPVDESVDVPKPIPYHDAENGAPNVLLRNDGNWSFTEATRSTGLDADNRRWSFAASWEDYDQDGDQDLYVANDFGRNCLYRNEAGRFENVAATAGVEDVASGMSVAWGDPNRDGLMDLYIGNMFSSAGNRITSQPAFRPATEVATRAQVRRMARGNSLFLAGGDGSFRDVSLEAAVSMGRWAWSSLFTDLNNDGWEDLVVANGFLTARSPDDL